MNLKNVSQGIMVVGGLLLVFGAYILFSSTTYNLGGMPKWFFPMMGFDLTVCGIVLYITNARQEKLRQLVSEGLPITTRYLQTRKVPSHNRYKNSYVIEAEGVVPTSDEKILFKSEILYKDASPELQLNQEITVYLDPQNKDRYYMDVNSLLKK